MAQHFLLKPARAGARQYRVGVLSMDARYSLHSSRLVIAGVVGVIVLAAVFVLATVMAIQTIDAKAINSERERAMIAIGLFQQAGQPMDSVRAGKIGRDYLLEDARLAKPGSILETEAWVPVAGTSLVFAWTPRRIGSMTAVEIAPWRITAASLTMFGVLFILHRLYRLARDLDTRRKAARDLATRDPLTGLANRRGFSEALEAGFAAGTPMSLLYLDLDDFKQVNDRYGHATGDELLVCVGQRLEHAVDSGDLVARLGGDEFVVLKRGLADRSTLTDLARRIHHRITLPYGLGDVEAEVGLSIGIASRSGHMMDARDLVNSADAALYRAKSIEATPIAFAEELVQGLPKAA